MSSETKLRYNVEKGYKTYSIQPYRYYKKDIKWYLLGLLAIGVAVALYLGRMPEYMLVILSTLTIVIVLSLLKELLLRIPLCYTFDANQNAIFKSNLISRNQKIFDLDKMVIFVSDSNEGWAYAIGEKKKHLVKNYKISEFFGDSKKSELKAKLYEKEILANIQKLLEEV